MSNLLKEILENYLDDRWDNKSLETTLDGLEDNQLQMVVSRLKEVNKDYGKCNLRKVSDAYPWLSINTDHPDDPGVSIDLRIYSCR